MDSYFSSEEMPLNTNLRLTQLKLLIPNYYVLWFQLSNVRCNFFLEKGDYGIYVDYNYVHI